MIREQLEKEGRPGGVVHLSWGTHMFTHLPPQIPFLGFVLDALLGIRVPIRSARVVASFLFVTFLAHQT